MLTSCCADCSLMRLPDLSFGCEVWGPWALESDKGNEQLAQNVVEHIRLLFAHCRMCKLALNSSTPACTFYREPGMGTPPAHSGCAPACTVHQRTVEYA
jgi:hypothetical protein